MIVGVPRETKSGERRVGLTPAGTRELRARGHRVLVERGAGVGSAIGDDDYAAAGANVGLSRESVFADAELVLKVKEPQPDEIALIHPNQLLFTFLHLAAYPVVARGLAQSGAICIAYETMEMPNGHLPLLAPMSEIAGRMASQVGARFLESPGGGKGKLLGGAAGVRPAKVMVLGAGIAGRNAARVASGMGASVTVLDINVEKLRDLDGEHLPNVTTEYSTIESVEAQARMSDLVVGAVLVAGDRAPTVMDETLIGDLEPGTVLVDISIDQGGCFATSRETSHESPVFIEHDVVHYAVGNIPAVVPHTSTHALTNATLKYVVAIAGGLESAVASFPELRRGLNIVHGVYSHPVVAKALDEKYRPLERVLDMQTPVPSELV